jgi:3-methyl-2-oxobutanoate hydroxymethyltransferase
MSTELTAPYGSGATPADGKPAKRVRIHHLREMKERGEAWPMLTAYDMYTAALFDNAGIPVLYQVSVSQAVETAVRFMKEGRAHAVKLEGGEPFAPHVAALTNAGIPVMGHIGFTPQSEHNLGGYRVQGRGSAGDQLVADALALQQAGAFSVVMEMVPGEVAKRITHELEIPTIGIGAGPDCDAQVLVWQDMAGLRTGKAPRFVKRYADVAGILTNAVTQFATEVRDREFPGPEHTFH